MFRKFLIPVVTIATFLVGFAFWSFWQHLSGDELLVQENPATISGTPISGELIRAQVILEKSINIPVEVLGVSTNCGCTEFAVDGVGALSESTGFIMKESIARCIITIDTKHKSGLQRFGYQIRYRRPGTKDVAWINGSIEVGILPGVVAEPDRIEIDSSGSTEPILVNLFDDMSGPIGVPLSHCEVSDRRVLRATLSSNAVTNAAFTRGDSFVPRHQLRVDWLAAPKPKTRHWINVVPAVPGAMTVQIPIIVGGINDGTYDVDPEKLVLINCGSVSRATRSVTLRSKVGWDSPPVVHFPKELCKVTIVPGVEPSERVARIELLTEQRAGFEVEFEFSSGKRLQLPVAVVCPD